MARCTVIAGSYERFVFGYGVHGDGAAGETSRLEKCFTADAHLSSVKCVAASGGFAASGGSDDLIRVYHCDASGAVADLGVLVGHEGDVRALAFHAPRGRAPTRLLSGGADGSVRVWDARDNFNMMKTMRAHRGGVLSIAAHGSGRVALTSGADSHVAMWDMLKGRVAYKFKTPERVERLTFTQDGKEYVSLTSKRLSVTDVEAGSIVRTFATPSKALTFEARGRVAYVGCEGGDVIVYDTRIEDAVGQIVKAHPQRVRGLAFGSMTLEEAEEDSNPKLLISAGSEGAVRVWDLRTATRSSAEVPAESVVEINTGARYTCLCAMPSENPPEAPEPKAAQDETANRKKQPHAKNAKQVAKAKVAKPQKKVVTNDEDFEIVPADDGPSGKGGPSRFDSDSDDAPFAKPTGFKKKRDGSYEKSATSARRKAHGIKTKKSRR